MPLKGFRHSLESRRRIAQTLSTVRKGMKFTDEHKKSMSLVRIGRKLSEETRRKMSIARTGSKNPSYGKKMPLETKQKLAAVNKDRVISEATRQKLSDANKGSKSHLWKGGISTKNQQIRGSREYKLWRKAVFERDNYTCLECGIHGGDLNADHIKPFALFPDLRFAIDNGRTLCVSCHRKTPTYGSLLRFKSKEAA